MGHSFGGITVLGAASKCPNVKAVISMDPWFFPHSKTENLVTLKD